VEVQRPHIAALLYGQAACLGAEEFHAANLVESHHLDALAEFFSSSQSANTSLTTSSSGSGEYSSQQGGFFVHRGASGPRRVGPGGHPGPRRADEPIS
jgi:hypothetical protein